MSKNDSNFSMLGETVKVRKVSGKYLVTNRPKRVSGKPSDKQASARVRFLAAAHYAGRQVALPASNALYASGTSDKKRNAFVVALNDFLKAPQVNSINTDGYRGAIGDPIVVDAVDDFMVTKVIVKIIDASGNTLEEGEAGPDEEEIKPWQYKARVANPTLSGTTIQAIAYDRPGNKGTGEVVL